MLVFLFATSLWGAKLSNDLQRVSPGTMVDVIVQFEAPPTEHDFDAVQVRAAPSSNGCPIFKAALFNASGGGAAGYRQQSACPLHFTGPETLRLAGIRRADREREYRAAVWLDGRGVGVAVIDSGISAEHPDLRYRVTYSENFVPGEDTINDVYGHGTHVAGIVGGDGSASTGANYIYTFRGIAPSANLMNLRVLDRDGQGTDSAVIRAIDRAIALKDTYGIRVVNLSLGRGIQESYTLDPLCQAVQRAWAAGLVVVVAAGNNGRDNSMSTSGYGTITSPGNSPYAITVGAMKDMATISRGDDFIASYSSKGPTLLDQVVKPDLVAPGNNIASAFSSGSTLSAALSGEHRAGDVLQIEWRHEPGQQLHAAERDEHGGTDGQWSGALLLQQQPALTPDQVKARLMRTATKNFPSTSIATDPITGATYTSTYDLFTVGAGYLDVWAALTDRTTVSGSALSPKAVYDSASGNTSVVFAPARRGRTERLGGRQSFGART